METVRGTGTKFSGWIDPPGGRVLLHFSRVRDAHSTWHVPPRKGLHKFVRASTGQIRDIADSKLAGHTYTTSICVLLWLPFLWGAGCTRQDRKTILTWGPRVHGKFELDTKLSRWVEFDMVCLAPYDLMGWSTVCSCARASALYLLFFYRPYRPNEGHPRSQTCRLHIYYPNMCVFLVAVVVGCRLHAPGPKNFIREGSSGSRKF